MPASRRPGRHDVLMPGQQEISHPVLGRSGTRRGRTQPVAALPDVPAAPAAISSPTAMSTRTSASRRSGSSGPNRLVMTSGDGSMRPGVPAILIEIRQIGSGWSGPEVADDRPGVPGARCLLIFGRGRSRRPRADRPGRPARIGGGRGPTGLRGPGPVGSCRSWCSCRWSRCCSPAAARSPARPPSRAWPTDGWPPSGPRTPAPSASSSRRRRRNRSRPATRPVSRRSVT